MHLSFYYNRPAPVELPGIKSEVKQGRKSNFPIISFLPLLRSMYAAKAKRVRVPPSVLKNHLIKIHQNPLFTVEEGLLYYHYTTPPSLMFMFMFLLFYVFNFLYFNEMKGKNVVQEENFATCEMMVQANDTDFAIWVGGGFEVLVIKLYLSQELV